MIVSYINDIAKIRLQNTINIVDSQFGGNWTTFAKRIKKARSYVSDLKNGHKSQFTEKLARHIENALGLAPQTLDRDPSKEILEDKITFIPVYNQQDPDFFANLIENKSSSTFPLEHSTIKTFGWQTANLLVLVSSSESMAPTIQNSSKILIDTSKTKIQEGKIYVLTKNNEIFVRRIFCHINNKYEAQPDNTQFKTFSFAESDDVNVIGQVVYLLGHKL